MKKQTIHKQEDRHSLNACKMIERKLAECRKMNDIAFSPFAPQGEIASRDFDNAIEEVWVQEPRLHFWKNVFDIEIRKRKLQKEKI